MTTLNIQVWLSVETYEEVWFKLRDVIHRELMRDLLLWYIGSSYSGRLQVTFNTEPSCSAPYLLSTYVCIFISSLYSKDKRSPPHHIPDTNCRETSVMMLFFYFRWRLWCSFQSIIWICIYSHLWYWRHWATCFDDTFSFVDLSVRNIMWVWTEVVLLIHEGAWIIPYIPS